MLSRKIEVSSQFYEFFIESFQSSGRVEDINKLFHLYAGNDFASQSQQKLESSSQRPSSDITREEYTMGTYKAHKSLTNDIVVDNPLQSNTRNRQLSESTKLNGNLQSCGIQNATDSTGVSQLSTPSSRSVSPTRHIKGGEYDSKFHSPRQGLIPILDTSSNNLWKQDIAVKVREHEEEISLLRKHLADYSIKVEKLQNEKCILEKRIAYMRMAFDQQQQDLVDAASKTRSYRQDIIEENIRLTYVLQVSLLSLSSISYFLSWHFMLALQSSSAL